MISMSKEIFEDHIWIFKYDLHSLTENIKITSHTNATIAFMELKWQHWMKWFAALNTCIKLSYLGHKSWENMTLQNRSINIPAFFIKMLRCSWWLLKKRYILFMAYASMPTIFSRIIIYNLYYFWFSKWRVLNKHRITCSHKVLSIY